MFTNGYGCIARGIGTGLASGLFALPLHSGFFLGKGVECCVQIGGAEGIDVVEVAVGGYRSAMVI